jgi:hypothetical protein
LHLFVADESDLRPREGARFFIYGGLIVPATNVARLHEAIEDIRSRAGYRATDALKFSTRSRPEQVSFDDFTLAKARVIAACRDHDVRFVSYAALHAIARNQNHDTLVTNALNTTIAAFNRRMVQEGSAGIVIVDRMPTTGEGYPLLKEKFQVGLTFPGGRTSRLERVHLYASSCDGASHLSSATDMVNDRGPASLEIARGVVPLMCYREEGGIRYVGEEGIFLRPRGVRVPSHREQYDELLAFLSGLM